MLFADFDWTRVLIAGAIGGVIGLLVWVIKQVSGKRGSGDGPGSRPSRSLEPRFPARRFSCASARCKTLLMCSDAKYAARCRGVCESRFQR